MADPTTTDALVEGGKIAGGGGLGFVLAKLLDRVFSRAEKDAAAREAKLDAILAAVNALGSKLEVLTERHASTRADVDKLEGQMAAIQREVAELAGAYRALTEQLAK